MAITRITDKTEIKEGDLIVPDSSLINGLVSRPRLITKVAGQRLYYTRPDDAEPEEKEQYMTRKRALFKVDTLSEAALLLELSTAKRRAHDRAEALINGKYRAALQDLIATGKVPEGIL